MSRKTQAATGDFPGSEDVRLSGKPPRSRRWKTVRRMAALTGEYASRYRGGIIVATLAGFVIAGSHLDPEGNVGAGMVAGLSESMGFTPSRLMLSGNEVVDEELVEDLLAKEMTGSLFSVNTARVRDRLLENPWFANAGVTKIYPDTLAIDVAERKPFAFWKAGEEFRLIARDGVVLGTARSEHMRLPQVVGSGANMAAPEFIATISRFPDLAGRSRAFVRVAERRWNLALRNDMTVMLPENGWREALRELQRLQQSASILDRPVVQIDMRLPDRLGIRLQENLAKARRERLEAILSGEWKQT